MSDFKAQPGDDEREWPLWLDADDKVVRNLGQSMFAMLEASAALYTKWRTWADGGVSELEIGGEWEDAEFAMEMVGKALTMLGHYVAEHTDDDPGTDE